MTRIVVTGAAGFIGSNIIKGLNQRGLTDIIAVDDMTQGDKFRNLADLHIADYIDADVFYDDYAAGALGQVEAVFHEGACSDTMELNGKYMMQNNYATSVQLYQACQKRGSRLLYASSAATYGGSDTFREDPAFEHPLNVYGYSKLLFDQRMRRECGLEFQRAFAGKTMQVVGFRYFNVYGPREQHKGRMASVAFHQFNQFRAEGKVKLFGEYGGYAAGSQMRDFVFIDDVVAVNLWFFDHRAFLASTTWARVARNPLTMSQHLWSTPCGSTRAKARCPVKIWSVRGCWSTWPFPTRCAANTNAIPRPT